MTDPPTCERDALEAAHGACPCNDDMTVDQQPCHPDGCICWCPTRTNRACRWIGHTAILAYGRAVREADKEAAVNGLLKWAGERNRYVHPELIEAIEAAIESPERE